MSWTGVITNAGQALLDQWAAGGHTMTIDRAAVGSGITSLADLLTATNLAHYEAAASIIKVEAVTGGTRFKIQVSPSASEAYQATEIGIWAHIDSEASVLMALHQDTEGGVAVPTQSQMPDFAFALYCIHAISNTSELTVNIDPSAFVSNAVFTEAVESLDSTKLAKTGDSKDNVTGFTSGDEADTAVTYDAGWSTVPALASGLKHSALFNRISTMMKNVRFLWKLIGDTDISGLSSQHTVTGALSKLNTDLISSKLLRKSNALQYSLHLPSGGRFVIFCVPNSSNDMTTILATVYGNGTVYINNLAEQSNTTFTTSTNAITANTITTSPMTFSILVVSLDKTVNIDDVTIS